MSVLTDQTWNSLGKMFHLCVYMCSANSTFTLWMFCCGATGHHSTQAWVETACFQHFLTSQNFLGTLESSWCSTLSITGYITVSVCLSHSGCLSCVLMINRVGGLWVNLRWPHDYDPMRFQSISFVPKSFSNVHIFLNLELSVLVWQSLKFSSCHLCCWPTSVGRYWTAVMMCNLVSNAVVLGKWFYRTWWMCSALAVDSADSHHCLSVM